MHRKPLFVRLLAAILMIAVLLVPLESFAQRRGSFGGGRSFGGGSLGGGRSSSGGGSFGRGSSNFGGIRSGSSGAPRTSTGSFGRSSSSSRSFGGPRTSTFTQSRGGSPFAPRASYLGSGFHTYGGGYYYSGYPVHYYGGGYGSYWFHPAWYYWMPFHPAFFYGGPVYNQAGYYEPGGFSFFRLFLAICIFMLIFWIIARLFSRP